MTNITPGWTFVSIGIEGARVSLSGLNPWQLKWHSMNESPITVAHPSYPQQRYGMHIYSIQSADLTVKFAAGEFSNGVWGFYLPEN